MASSGMLRRVAHVRTDVSEEPSASFIRVTKIGELGTTQAATSNRRTLRISHTERALGGSARLRAVYTSRDRRQHEIEPAEML
jgi:hypothetical protein